MKLFYITGSCSLTPRMLMNEIGVDCEYIKIEKKKTGDYYATFFENGEPFAEIDLKAQIPTLMLDDGSILSENANILYYLADRYAASNVLPEIGNIKRYQVIEWVNYIATELHKTFTFLFYKDEYGTDAGKKVYQEAEKKLSFVDKKLEGRDFLIDQFTIADMYMFVVLSWCRYLNIDLSKYKNIQRSYNAIIDIPSVQKSIKDEKLTYKKI